MSVPPNPRRGLGGYVGGGFCWMLDTLRGYVGGREYVGGGGG